MIKLLLIRMATSLLPVALIIATMAFSGTSYALHVQNGTPNGKEPTASCTASVTNAGTLGSSTNQVLHGVGQAGGDCNGSGVKNIISAVVDILSIIVGVAAVIAILLGGYRYINSGGDSNKVSSAKSTLIYAVVGLLIAALAQFIVHAVLKTGIKASS